MKEKMSQLFKDKVFLVLLVLGLLTIVAAAGVITIQRGNDGGQSPYLEVPDQKGVIAEETIPQENQVAVAGDSNAEQGYSESRDRSRSAGGKGRNRKRGGRSAGPQF